MDYSAIFERAPIYECSWTSYVSSSSLVERRGSDKDKVSASWSHPWALCSNMGETLSIVWPTYRRTCTAESVLFRLPLFPFSWLYVQSFLFCRTQIAQVNLYKSLAGPFTTRGSFASALAANSICFQIQRATVETRVDVTKRLRQLSSHFVSDTSRQDVIPIQFSWLMVYHSLAQVHKAHERPGFFTNGQTLEAFKNVIPEFYTVDQFLRNFFEWTTLHSQQETNAVCLSWLFFETSCIPIVLGGSNSIHWNDYGSITSINNTTPECCYEECRSSDVKKAPNGRISYVLSTLAYILV